MKTLTETFITTLKFYGASDISALEIAEDLLQSVREYNNEVLDQSDLTTFTEKEIRSTIEEKQEKLL